MEQSFGIIVLMTNQVRLLTFKELVFMKKGSRFSTSFSIYTNLRTNFLPKPYTVSHIHNPST